MKSVKKLLVAVIVVSLLIPTTNVDYCKHSSEKTVLADGGGNSMEYEDLDGPKPIILPKSIHILKSI